MTPALRVQAPALTSIRSVRALSAEAISDHSVVFRGLDDGDRRVALHVARPRLQDDSAYQAAWGRAMERAGARVLGGSKPCTTRAWSMGVSTPTAS